MAVSGIGASKSDLTTARYAFFTAFEQSRIQMCSDDTEPGNTIVPMRARPLANPPRPPDPPDMLEARVAHLEEDVKDLMTDMKTVVKDLAYLRGRVENLPTTWILLTSIAASQAALLGFTFTMLRFLMPHP
jgi:hypothetical protein